MRVSDTKTIGDWNPKNHIKFKLEVCLCVYVCVCVYKYIYIYIHIYTYNTRIHIYTAVFSSSKCISILCHRERYFAATDAKQMELWLKAFRSAAIEVSFCASLDLPHAVDYFLVLIMITHDS